MPLYRLGKKSPTVHESAYVAPNAALIGNVVLGAKASVWFGATLRGDLEPISVGPESNVQDGVVMHTDPGFPILVGAQVTVGHLAMLHGCQIDIGSLIGIQATVLTGARIGKYCLVGAGSVVTERKVFPDRSLIIGSPARVVRELSDTEVAQLQLASQDYVRRRDEYNNELVLLDHAD